MFLNKVMGRQLGPFSVAPIGLGCMNLSHAYGKPPSYEESERLLHKAIDLGYNYFDSAALYGFGHNESLLGKAIKRHRDQIILGSKCGLFKGADGARELNGSPESIQRICEESLRRLQTETIDLYHLHRRDYRIPIEDSMGALSDLVTQGKIRAIGLSEVSAETLSLANTIHPVTAVQTEYSLWTRNPEIKLLQVCKELGVSVIAFSPLARAFLTGELTDISDLDEGDIRLNMPRFQGDNFKSNLMLLNALKTIAADNRCTMAQLALAWVLSQGDYIIPIPGTKNIHHLEENWYAKDIKVDAVSFKQLDALINQNTIMGQRYNISSSREIDTEGF